MQTIQEVAAQTGCRPATVYKAIAEGRLAATKRYGRLLVDNELAARWMTTVGKRNGIQPGRKLKRYE